MKHEICPVPFSTLIFNPDGNIGCCRELTNEDTVGHMDQLATLDTIWNGEIVRKWRRDFLHGIPQKCKKQMKNLQCHKSGINQQLALTTEYTEYQKNPPIMISPDLNGECNLKCVMCDVWQLPNGLYNTRWDFWQFARKELFPYIKYVDPLSGEPFIQKDFFRLINEIHAVNPEAIWRFTTNGQWCFSPYIEKHLDKICIDSFQYSVDGGKKETFESIRKGSSFTKLLKNIENNFSYRDAAQKKYKVLSLTVVMKNNWKEIPLIIKLMTERSVIPYFTYCSNFPELQIDSYSEKEKEVIINYLLTNVDEIKYIYRLISWLIESSPSNAKYKKIMLLKLKSRIDQEHLVTEF